MKAILQWVLRTMMKDQTGIVRTMPKKDLVDFNVAMTAERLMRNGIDPNSLKNANQVENAINQIEAPRNVQQGIKSTKSAKIMDMEGKEIDPRSKIMGGKQAETEEEILERLNKENKEGIESLKQKMAKEKSRTQRISGNLRADNASRTEIGRPKLDEDEYDYYREILGENAEYDYYPVKGDETKEMLEAMVKEQKDEMAYMKKLYDKGALDDPDKMATGGRAGFVAGGIINLAMRLARGFMKVTGRKPNDEELMKIIREAAERDFAKVSDDVALKGVSETRATARRMDSIDKNKLKKEIDEYNIPVRTQEQFDFAQGGRAGFKLGSIDKARRAFLKTMGAAGAGITALKTGILGLGKEAAPAVEAVKETVTQAPSYFFDLVAKIKLLGEPRRTPSYKERVNEYQYTGKNGIEYELIEDLDTGEITIQKDKIGGRSFEEGSYEVIEDRTEMRYRKPKPDEGDPNPAEEYEEYKVEFDQEGTAADASEIDEISKKEIIREVTEDAPSIKKAGGGIARMLGE